MHFEILVEDQSGKSAIDILVPKIIGQTHTYKVHYYKGIGHIPKSMLPATDAKKRILLDQLPRLINGFGRSYNSVPFAMLVICDLDNKCLKMFRNELIGILHRCQHKPNIAFCFAIEEGEAWLLGDIEAIKKAYPKCKYQVLKSYANDSICGTWEILAEAIYPGGKNSLKSSGYQEIGKVKSEWARKISQYMDVDNNNSPSFNYFKDRLLRIINESNT